MYGLRRALAKKFDAELTLGACRSKGMHFWRTDEMRTPEDVFEDYDTRRRGILRALTTE